MKMKIKMAVREKSLGFVDVKVNHTDVVMQLGQLETIYIFILNDVIVVDLRDVSQKCIQK